MKYFPLFCILALLIPACSGMDKEEKVAEPQGTDCITDADCTRSGCSGTVCQSKNREPLMTTCEWRSEYACFEAITCGCDNGYCGWPDDGTLDVCIAAKK